LRRETDNRRRRRDRHVIVDGVGDGDVVGDGIVFEKSSTFS
jgi:hypothetical protein